MVGHERDGASPSRDLYRQSIWRGWSFEDAGREGGDHVGAAGQRSTRLNPLDPGSVLGTLAARRTRRRLDCRNGSSCRVSRWRWGESNPRPSVPQ